MSRATLLTSAGVIKDETVGLANTATRVGTMLEDIINEAEIPTYTKYIALISQAGTSAPTLTVLENTLAITVTPTYTDVGIYTLTSVGAFTSSKTLVTPASGYSTNFGGLELNNYRMRTYLNDADSITVNSFDGTSLSNGILVNGQYWLEIKVYS